MRISLVAAAATAAVAVLPVYRTAEGSPDLRALGRQVYREGRLASGRPVQATVLGDVPADGSQFTCFQCHGSSGLGTSEGRIRVLPIDGPDLFQGRKAIYRSRPAYTQESLDTLLRTGVDPAGNKVDSLMPKYELPPLEMKALTEYLRSLSDEHSPGVAEEEIHLATVVTGDAPPQQTAAMLRVLNAFVKAKNAETRAEGHRARAGPFYHEYKNRAYRKWVLHVWNLHGDADEWRVQLEREYAKQPVFAMLSGMGAATWQPVHRFCEDTQLPCMLPNVDAPPVRDGDFYTLYFSKGLALEADVIATDLLEQNRPLKVVQVFRRSSTGAEAAAAFRVAAARIGRLCVIDKPVTRHSAVKHASTEPDAAVLWLDSADLESIPPPSNARVYVSSTLLGGNGAAVPSSLRRNTLMVHPYSLPSDFAQRVVREEAFFRARGIELNPATQRVELQTYFACQVLGGALTHIKRRFYRDYLMDALDHFQRMAGFTAAYPRLSFGPRQRYLAKGAYVLPVGPNGDLVPDRSRWIVPAM